jgi:sorbitol-6-phosphate 2-dehydrogenase
MNTSLKTFAPYLRGLSFDGEKGQVVVVDTSKELVGDGVQKFAEALKAKGLRAPLIIDSLPENFDAAKDLIKKCCEAELSKNKHFPTAIFIAGQGAYFLSASYDHAIAVQKFYVNGITAIHAGQTPVTESGCTRHEQVEKKSCPHTSAKPKLEFKSPVSGRIAVVTGGAQGFGEGIVRELIARDCLVYIADLNIDGAKKLSDSLNTEAGKTVSLAVAVNIMDENSVENMIFDISNKTGGLDLFVANAGVLKAGSVKEMDKKDFDFVTNVNYTGFFLCVKHASKIMALQNEATGKYFTDIIQINSKSGLEGSNKNGAYAGGKFGGIGLTQSFALELVTDNIKVNAICPGNFFDGPLWSDPDRGLFVQYLRTGKVAGAKTIEDVKAFYEAKVPMGRGCYGEDVAKAIVYAVDQKYETGQAIPVTGGQVMLN